MIYHAARAVNLQRFSLEAFKFIAYHPFVFVHCHVTVCNATDSGSQCAKECSSTGRRKRAVGDHVHDDVYSLAQGPLLLSGSKREEKIGDSSGSDKNGMYTISKIERFSIECRKTKTKVITTANENKGKYSKEPMRTQRKYK